MGFHLFRRLGLAHVPTRQEIQPRFANIFLDRRGQVFLRRDGLHPQLAEGDQIIAIPTLVRQLPSPIKKIIGDLSNVEKTLVGLDLIKQQ